MRERRLSAFDLFFAVVLITVFLVVVLYVFRGGTGGTPTGATVTVKVSAVEAPVAERLGVDEVFSFDGTGGATRIEPCVVGTAKKRHVCRDGVIRVLPSTDRYDVVMTFRCEGTEENDGFYLGGNLWLGANLAVTLSGDGVECRGKILDVRRNFRK